MAVSARGSMGPMGRWSPALVASLALVISLVAAVALVSGVHAAREPAGGVAGHAVASVEAPTTSSSEAPRALATPSSSPPAPPTTTVPLVDGVAFVGDSLAENLGSGLVTVGPRQGIAVFDDAISGCGVAASGGYRLSGAQYELSPTCAAWADTWAVRLRRDKPKVVAVQLGRHEVLDRLYQGRWTNILDPGYLSYVRGELQRGIRIAGADGAKVVLLTAPRYQRPERPGGGQWPENDPARVDRFNGLLRELVAGNRSLRLIDLGARTSPGTTYVDVVDGVVLRTDGVHYSPAGVEWIGRWLLPQLAGLLQP